MGPADGSANRPPNAATAPVELRDVLVIETMDGKSLDFEVVGLVEDLEDNAYAVCYCEKADEFVVTDPMGNLLSDDDLAQAVLDDFFVLARESGDEAPVSEQALPGRIADPPRAPDIVMTTGSEMPSLQPQPQANAQLSTVAEKVLAAPATLGNHNGALGATEVERSCSSREPHEAHQYFFGPPPPFSLGAPQSQRSSYRCPGKTGRANMTARQFAYGLGMV